MNEKIGQFVSNLNGTKANLVQIRGYLQQFKELATGAFVEDARSSAELGEEIEAYKNAIEFAYGVIINVEFWDNLSPDAKYDILAAFQYGLDQMASFLETTYFDEETIEFINSYEFFQSVMGNLSLEYVNFDPTNSEHLKRLQLTPSSNTNCPDASSDGPCQEDCTYSLGRGFASGHTIYFYKGSRTYTCREGSLDADDVELSLLGDNQSSRDNVVHELFHALNMFSGFGGQREGSPFEADVTEFFDPNRLQSAQVNRQNSSDDLSEILADLGLFTTYGAVDDDSIMSVYEIAIRQARVYHMTPNEYSEALNLNQPIQTGLLQPGYALRILPGGGYRQWMNVIEGSPIQVSIIGQSGDWYYVAIPTESQAYQYTWVNKAGMELSDNIGDIAQITDVQSTNPIRPFEE